MKRAVLCVENPHDYIDQLKDYSIMIVNPNVAESRLKYLLDNSDYSLLITKNAWEDRQGGVPGVPGLDPHADPARRSQIEARVVRR